MLMKTKMVMIICHGDEDGGFEDDGDVDGDDDSDGDADDDDAAVDAGGDAGDHADDAYDAHAVAQDLLGCIMIYGALGCTRMLAVQRARL